LNLENVIKQTFDVSGTIFIKVFGKMTTSVIKKLPNHFLVCTHQSHCTLCISLCILQSGWDHLNVYQTL